MAQQLLLTRVFQTSVSKREFNQREPSKYHYPIPLYRLVDRNPYHDSPTKKNSGIFDGSLGIVPDVLIATSMLTGRDECHVAIRVSDRAGGIPSDVGDRIWFES